jgi:hypothetical protein
LRIGVTVLRGRGVGRIVVGVALGVGLATVTDVEGDEVVLSVVTGAAEGVALD